MRYSNRKITLLRENPDQVDSWWKGCYLRIHEQVWSRTFRSLCLALLFLLINLRCSTTLQLINDISEDGPPTLYGGTQIDIVLIYGGARLLESPLDCGGLALLALVGGLVDLPLSFAADTVLLPVTVLWYFLAYQGESSGPHPGAHSEAVESNDAGNDEIDEGTEVKEEPEEKAPNDARIKGPRSSQP
ncbi:MAG: YceK/YidQ family lipoprotein [Leptospiraceae bacterium]